MSYREMELSLEVYPETPTVHNNVFVALLCFSISLGWDSEKVTVREERFAPARMSPVSLLSRPLVYPHR